MRFIKEKYQQTKHHHKNFLLLFLTALLTPLLVFSFYSIFPPKVLAENQGENQLLDQPFIAEIWGLLNKDSVQVEIDPKIPVSVRFLETKFPLKNSIKIEPKNLLNPNTSYSVKLTVKNWLGINSEKVFRQTTKAFPEIVETLPSTGSLNVLPNSILKFKLDQTLTKGNFYLIAAPKADFSITLNEGKIVAKPKKPLQQGVKYSYKLFLKSENFPETLVTSGELTTITPLEILSLDPADGNDLVLKQQPLQIKFNKIVNKKTFEQGLKLEPKTDLILSWVDDQTVSLKPTSVWLSATKYTANLDSSIKSTDQSHLATKTITFTTVGPVKVVSFSPTGAYPYLTSPIVVNFNQPVDQESAKSHFRIEPNVAGIFSFSGNQLVFKPNKLNSLTEYKVNLTGGILSLGGENSVETFSNSFTTTSEQNRVIGYSVQGKPIKATYFGIGPKKILLIGSLHGNESNTGKMLDSWISYLRANQNQIAKDRTFVILPYTNPDGVGKNQRFNANGVDLNRNWDTPQWQALTYLQNKSYPTGGGSTPFSEPESQALRNLILAEQPNKIITYHSSANMVIGDGISQAFGDWYAAKTGYTRVSGDNESDSNMSALGYIITGTLEDWATIRNLTTLVVEFISQTQNEYSRNLPALKGLLTYPL